jgi:hypothetical protein
MLHVVAHFLWDPQWAHPGMKNSVHVSHTGHTKMHYVTRISYWMQNYKFGVMCPSVLFVGSAPSLPEHEK